MLFNKTMNYSTEPKAEISKSAEVMEVVVIVSWWL